MRILVLQHHAAEHPGIFRDFMVDDGVYWDAVHLHDGDPLPSLDGYDALWVMGGPMDVWEETRYPWLAPEKAYIREAVLDRGMPFLGCCLGHQLLAEVAGGECRPLTPPEVGVHDVELTADGRADPLLAGVEPRFKALQWHGVEVATAPPNATVLAASPASAHQAIRIGDRAWGLQYHVEATADTIDEWGVIPEYAQALRQALGDDPLPRLRADTAANASAFRRNARKIYDNFLNTAF